jgi:hypothetical protein
VRTRDEVEKDVDRHSAPSSGAMNSGSAERIMIELLLDIRDQLEVIAMHQNTSIDQIRQLDQNVYSALSGLKR